MESEKSDVPDGLPVLAYRLFAIAHECGESDVAFVLKYYRNLSKEIIGGMMEVSPYRAVHLSTVGMDIIVNYLSSFLPDPGQRRISKSAKTVRWIFGHLTENERRILFLRYLNDINLSDLQEVMTMDKNTVLKLCSSAERKIAKVLVESLPGFFDKDAR